MGPPERSGGPFLLRAEPSRGWDGPPSAQADVGSVRFRTVEFHHLARNGINHCFIHVSWPSPPPPYWGTGWRVSRRPPSLEGPMLRNYLLTALRNLERNRLYGA